MKLETEHLILRDFSAEDISDYTKLTQDEKYQRFYSEADCSEEKACFLVKLFIEQAQENPRSKFQLAIVEKTSAKLIGTCGVRLEEHRQASMGCGVAREFQGKGYALEASGVLLQYAFEQLNVHRVYAETISENRAAIFLCRQLGMEKEAHFRQHRYFKQRWWDTVVYALTKSDAER